MVNTVVSNTPVPPGQIALEVCPNYVAGACTCPQPVEHPTYTFSANPPAGDTRTQAQWQTACSQEAVRLSWAETHPGQTCPATAGATAVGMTL